MTEEDNYFEELMKLVDGITTGRLQIIKIDKKAKTKNTEMYNITVLDTAIPGGRKPRTKKPTKTISKDVIDNKKEKPKQQSGGSGPIPPKRPVMCRIEKIE